MFTTALLIEDEDNLATALELSLKRMGLERVDVGHSIAEGRATFAKMDPPPGLVVLDRMLPDGEGLDFCVELRASGYTGAVLVLTASGMLEERVQGLDRGADDYLAKPFSWVELEARIRALARRYVRAAATSSTVSPDASALWTCDDQEFRILGPRGWVTLTPLEHRLVKRLLVSPARNISRDVLLKDVWGFSLLPKTRTVDYFMTRVRKNFELDPENPRHFLTVRGVGYRFEP